MDDLIETLLYLVSFWRFVFSKQYRIDLIAKFKRQSLYRKFLDIVGAIVSTSVGLGLPIVIILLLVGFPFSDNADSCLDSGGSYNYQKCECDYKINHEYSKVHQCF